MPKEPEMGKSKFKAEKAAQLRRGRQAAATKKKYANARYEVVVKKDCGCCEDTLHFRDEASAKAAFAKAGLTNGGVIVDDAGDRHEGLDTFYGFRAPEEPQRGLQDLFDIATGKKGWPA
jgi:hypothetical protein